MPASVRISDAAASICQHPVPVLLLDTCALLDTLRVASTGYKIPARIVPAARQILSRVNSTPKTLWLVGAEIVNVEWNDNRKNMLDQISNHIGQVDRALMKLHTAVRAIPSIASNATRSEIGAFASGVDALQLRHLDLPSKLMEICDQLVSSAILIRADEQVLTAANLRSMEGLKPASRGKRERADCQIIESYFALCRLLRAQGHVEPCVFVSSNTADFFGEGSPLRPHEDIALECSAVGLQLALEFSHALSILFPR
jgi:hypothetical protein